MIATFIQKRNAPSESMSLRRQFEALSFLQSSLVTMKFTVAALLAALATTGFAQSVIITNPPNNFQVSAGDVINVGVNYSSSLENVMFISGLSYKSAPSNDPPVSYKYFFNVTAFNTVDPSSTSTLLQQNFTFSIPFMVNTQAPQASQVNIPKGTTDLFIYYYSGCPQQVVGNATTTLIVK